MFDTLDEDLQLVRLHASTFSCARLSVLITVMLHNGVQALQRACNVWAPGIEIIAVRVTKPKIPRQLQENFEAIEAEKTKLLIATQHKSVVEYEAETDLLKATIQARKVAEVSKINMEKEILEKEAQRS